MYTEIEHTGVLVTQMTSHTHLVAPCVISIRSEWDIIAARMAARDAARKMGFSTIDQARIATATSELTRNIIAYAREGTVTISQIWRDGEAGIEIIFADTGPGSRDVEHMLREQVENPRNGKRGLGLNACRRLMDELIIDTHVDLGTTIICRKWLS